MIFYLLVIAIDIDPVKVACARHNAELYGVADRIEFIVGDYFNLLPHMKVLVSPAACLSLLLLPPLLPLPSHLLPSLHQCADVVFLSPPWGGPSYTTSSIFSLHSMTPLDGYPFKHILSNNSAYYLLLYP